MTPDTQLQILQFEKTTQAISEYPVSRFTSDSQIVSGIPVLPLAPLISQSESWRSSFHLNNSSHSQANETHFQMNSCAQVIP